MTMAALAPPAAADRAPHPKYRADIDGLRAVAVLSVVGFHAFPDWVAGGFIGVDVFFVISGFLISGIILGEIDRGGFSFATFYSRRIRRIFSALIVVLLGCYAAGWFLLVADDFRDLGKHIAGGAGFVANLVQWSEAGYFAQASETQPLLHLWSLGIEEQFYLAWPLLLYLAFKRRVNALAVIAAVIGMSFAVDVLTVKTDAVASFYSPLSRFWELLVGSGLAYWTLHRKPSGGRNANLQSIVGMLLIAAGLLALNPGRAFPGWWALLPTLGAVLIIAAGTEAWTNRRLLGNPAVAWIGLISYPIYLWHWPLLSFARIVENDVPTRTVRIAAVLASVFLAWLTYVLVEKPIRARGGNRLKVSMLCAALGGVFLLGYLTYLSDGIAARPANHDEKALFVHHYEEMQRNGLKAAYHTECDFYDWRTARRKASIDPSCVQRGERGTVLLWGDSHAQALSPGLRSVMPQGYRLAQIATAGCKPALEPSDAVTTGGACNDSNAFARSQVAALKPEVVILAQVARHLRTDWEAIADFAHANGAGRVILMGPVPQWRPTLPAVVAHDYWKKDRTRVKNGLDASILETDRKLAAKYAGSTKLTYVSLVESLCNAQGCLATIPGREGYNLLVADYGHLTPDASAFVAARWLRPYLGRAGEVAASPIPP